MLCFVLQFPDAYAPYLYDAVQVWARAVNLTLQIGGNPRDGNLIYKMVPADTLSSKITYMVHLM